MKISKSLPQFEKEPSLFLVTGKQDAAFYKAYDGMIEHIASIKVPTPRYSDREGLYRQKGRGEMVTSGGFERRDDIVIRDFIHELKFHLKAMHGNDYAKMYVFTPSNVKNTILRAMPSYLRRKTAAVIEGNYYKSSPIDLLHKIAPIAAASQQYINEEARHILETSEQARSVVSNKHNPQ
jgi:hypothetical protein